MDTLVLKELDEIERGQIDGVNRDSNDLPVLYVTDRDARHLTDRAGDLPHVLRELLCDGDAMSLRIRLIEPDEELTVLEFLCAQIVGDERRHALLEQSLGVCIGERDDLQDEDDLLADLETLELRNGLHARHAFDETRDRFVVLFPDRTLEHSSQTAEENLPARSEHEEHNDEREDVLDPRRMEDVLTAHACKGGELDHPVAARLLPIGDERLVARLSSDKDLIGADVDGDDRASQRDEACKPTVRFSHFEWDDRWCLGVAKLVTNEMAEDEDRVERNAHRHEHERDAHGHREETLDVLAPERVTCAVRKAREVDRPDDEQCLEDVREVVIAVGDDHRRVDLLTDRELREHLDHVHRDDDTHHGVGSEEERSHDITSFTPRPIVSSGTGPICNRSA